MILTQYFLDRLHVASSRHHQREQLGNRSLVNLLRMPCNSDKCSHKASDQIEKAYNNPVMKTAQTPIFLRNGSCNFQITGNGSIKM